MWQNPVNQGTTMYSTPRVTQFEIAGPYQLAVSFSDGLDRELGWPGYTPLGSLLNSAAILLFATSSVVARRSVAFAWPLMLASMVLIGFSIYYYELGR